MKRFLRVFACFGFVALFAALSSTAQSSKPAVAMTNDDVIALVGVGMGDDVVIAKIKSAPKVDFDTSVTGLKALKAAGVSTPVLRVMIDPKASVGAPVVASAAVNDPDDPMSPHNGFYMERTGPDGKMHMEKLLLTTSAGVKGPSFGSALGSAYSFGIHKMKTKTVIPGTKAEIQTTNTSPTFWIYPAEGMSIQNTELVKLEIKKDTREATGATIGGFSGVSVGGAQGAGQGLKTEKIKDGVYKVTATNPLVPGSYAFIEGAGGSYRDFDVVATP